ncbi:MAG: cold shock domain-containing protein [Acidimicrobiales bacterium]
MSLLTRRGTVESFDVDVGIGHIVDDEGDRWMFHCTTIADGTRVIDPGATVGFEVAAGGPGRWEAFSVSA